MEAHRTEDGDEAARLLQEGHCLRRLAHDMATSLASFSGLPATAAPPGLLLHEIDRKALTDIVAAAASATPASHVDSATWANMDRHQYWTSLLGEDERPLERAASRLLRLDDGLIVGGIVVTVKKAVAWWPGGAWISEIFVVPAHQRRGLGRLLLTNGLRAAAAAGHGAAGLTVSEGNPAKRLYERFGFQAVHSTWFIEPGPEDVSRPSRRGVAT